jgi:hypothetical protein
MKALTQQQQRGISGGKWGFLCGVAVGLGIGASIASGGAAIGPSMLAAEWACALDVVANS